MAQKVSVKQRMEETMAEITKEDVKEFIKHVGLGTQQVGKRIGRRVRGICGGAYGRSRFWSGVGSGRCSPG